MENILHTYAPYTKIAISPNLSPHMYRWLFLYIYAPDKSMVISSHLLLYM